MVLAVGESEGVCWGRYSLVLRTAQRKGDGMSPSLFARGPADMSYGCFQCGA